MNTKINFGKIAFYSNLKTNAVQVEMELKQKECINYDTMQKQVMYIFSASAHVWNSTKTDIVAGGQMLDDLLEYIHTPLFKEIHGIWKEYHLNDLQAGTIKQQQAIKSFIDNGFKYEYKEACKMLETVGLFEDNGYKYGHGWLCKEIPANVVERIKKIIETN